MSVIYPKSLKKGAKIAIISPAGAVEKKQLQSSLEIIANYGYKPVLGKNLYKKFEFGYSYAGTEEERLNDLNWALNDDGISGIWASRGGYGGQQLLKRISLKKFKKNPKWYIGYSDNTAIQSYLLKHNYASIHGQTIKTSSFGVSEGSYRGIFDILQGGMPRYTLKNYSLNKEGRAEGQVIGGNLALIYALLGSNYSYIFKNKILFIEDIGENFYALDRMLMSLDLAGVFKKIKGLIIGGMTNMGEEKSNACYYESFDPLAYNIISSRISQYDFPTVFNFPNGHIYENLPLVIGANVKLKIGKKFSSITQQ